jgi:hypothetical protein
MGTDVIYSGVASTDAADDLSQFKADTTAEIRVLTEAELAA